MKRIILVFMLLLLITSAALANVTHDGNNYVKRAAFSDNDSIGLFHQSYGGMYTLDDYDTLKSTYSGKPEWSVEWVGDSHGVTFNTGYYQNNQWLWDDNNDRRALGIWFRNEPTEPCTLKYKVTCSWGTTQYSTVTTLDYLAVDLSSVTGLEFPDELSMLHVNEPYSIYAGVPYACSQFSNNVMVNLKSANIWCYKEGNNLVLTPQEKGAFKTGIEVNVENISLQKDVWVIVGDAVAANEPEILLRYEGGQPFVKSSLNLAIIEDPIPNVGNHSSTFTAEIRNYSELKQTLQGEPQWSITYRNNPPQQLELIAHSSPRSVSVWTEQYTPTTECTIKANINITWDTLSYSFPMDINFVKTALPSNYSIPTSVHMRVGETATVGAGFGDYSFSDVKIIKGSLDDGNFDELFTISNYSGGAFKITPKTTASGSWHGKLTIRDMNIGVSNYDVLFLVEDENGHVPALAFRNEFQQIETMPAFTDDNSIGLSHDGWLGNVQIDDFEGQKQRLSGNPVWSVEMGGNQYNTTASCSVWDDGSGIDINLENEPTVPCSLKCTVTCTWGGESVSVQKRILYEVPDSLPQGLDIADEYRGLKVGEPFSIDVETKPAGYTYGGFDRVSAYSDMDFDKERNGSTLIITPNEAGTFVATVTRRFKGIYLEKNVVLYVDNSTGPRLNNSYSWNMSLDPVDDKGYDVVAWYEAGSVNIRNWDTMYQMFGDNFNWAFEYRGSGIEPQVTWSYREGYFLINLMNFEDYSEGTELEVKATLTWGDTVRETTFYFHIMRMVLPNSINFETEYSMNIGDTHTAVVSFQPSNWYDDYFLYYDFSDESAFEKWMDSDHNKYYFRAIKSGAFMARPHIHASNVFIYGEWSPAFVYDANGNLPEVTPFFDYGDAPFEQNVYIGPADSETAEGWVCSATVFNWWLDNIPVLKSKYGANPTVQWTYERTGGTLTDDKVTLRLNLLKHEFVVGDACEVQVAKMPSTGGTFEFNLYCDWNGHRGTLPCKFTFIKPTSVPQTNTFPDTILMRVGETRELTASYSGGTFSQVAANWAWIYADEEYLEVDRPSNDRFTVSIKALKRGVITARGDVGVGNGFVQKLVNVVIADKVLILPASLTVIESGAFAGISNAAFYVPDTVVTIASDAFNSNAVIVCDKGSRAESICKGYGLTVVTE